MTQHYLYHRLKTQTLHGHTRISIPETWDCHRQGERQWWCGDETLGTGLFFKAVFMPSSPGPDGESPSKDALATDTLGQLRAFLDTVEIEGEPEYDLVERDFQIVHVVIDHVEDGETIRTYRWYASQIFDDGVADIRFTLVMGLNRIDDPAHAELVEIFAAQVRRLAGWVGDDEGDHDETRLRRQDFGARVSIRIPEPWGCRKDDEAWWCWDRRDRPGKLVVFWRFEPTPEVSEPTELAEVIRDYTDRLLAAMSEHDLTVVDRTIEVRGDNIFVYVVEDDTASEAGDDPDALRLHTWHLMNALDGGILDATVVFMFPRAKLDTEHYRNLLDIFSGTVPEAELR